MFPRQSAPPSNGKKHLRASMLLTRDDCSQALEEKVSSRAKELLQSFRPTQVGVYANMGSELPTIALRRILEDLNIPVAYPRVYPARDMKFHIASFDSLKPGIFGVNEPAIHTPVCIPSHIFVPGLAFDQTGGRVGWGGGHYDRYLAKHPEVVAIGYCYHEQIVEEVPSTSHDISMNYIVTDQVTLTTRSIR